ncbi:hypothetical protein ACI78T_15115 [Blastococcus sp. SYSU D00922]
MTPGTDWIDQAQRLVEAVRGSLASAVPPADGETEGEAQHSSDCRWCPICQVASVVRGERPEVTAALADLLTTAAAALRTVAEAGQPAEPAAQPEQDGEPPAPVQQIDIA